MFIPGAYRRLKRGPQVILPKDIGIVLAYTGVGRESRCVDAGAGSGWLAVSLARVCKEVTTYDTREDFLKIVEKNRKAEGLENLILRKGDVTKKIYEKDVDLVTLDLPNSDRAVGKAYRALREGGQIFGYLPHVEQVKKFVAKMERYGFSDIVVLEAIVRDMLVRKEGSRPSTKGVWHTGYLVFGCKKAAG
ncbi:MAG: methyltransferase domain-containing protein [Candidatus Marsarchaeota archaeon]|jgi:tRNA (adenine57-N1/adenine58-N1)-methyltransferase|nr:methyltransferase domain-containing protein [Candidatus Marsarchaeota archaeon]